MISTATLRDESLLTGAPSSPASRPRLVFIQEFDGARPLPISDSTSLDDLLGSLQGDLELQAAMHDARREMASTLYSDEPKSLSALRLRSGLSQAQLASLMQTSQPYIARIEAGVTDPGTEVISRIADALGVSETEAFLAVRHQRTTRGKRSD